MAAKGPACEQPRVNQAAPFSRRALLVAYVLALIPAVATALLQPMWSLIDESDHYDLIAHYANGEYPAEGSFITQQTLAIDQATDIWGYGHSGSLPPPIHVRPFEAIPAGLTTTQRDLWIKNHIWEFSKEVSLPPLYYAAGVPVLAAGQAAGGPTASVYALRLFNALLAATVAPFSLLIAWAVWPGRRLVAFVAAAIGASLAGPLLGHTHVTSDVLGMVLGSAALLVAVRSITTSDSSTRQPIVIGFLFGLGILARLNVALLWPALALAVLLTRERRRGVPAVGLLTASSVVTIAPWLVLNLVVFGAPTQLSRAFAWFPEPPPPADPGWWAISTMTMAGGFFAGEPFGMVVGSFWIAAIGLFLTVFALAGLMRLSRDSASGANRRVLAVLAVAVGTTVVGAAAYPAFAGTSLAAPGRYIFIVLPAATALLGAGLFTEFRRPVVVAGSASLLIAVSLAGLTTFLLAPASVVRGPDARAVAAATAISGAGTYGAFEVAALRCTRDRAGHEWLYIHAANSGSQPLDWLPVAETSSGTKAIKSDYASSTELPRTLEAGKSVEGWLRLGPARLFAAAQPAVLIFRNVAEDGYQTIGDLELTISPC